MPAYDATFSPPAPVAKVTVAHPVTGTSSGIMRGKLDSGADLSVIPARIVTQLKLSPRGYVWTKGYEGSYSRRPVYYVRMQVEAFDIPTVRCIATERVDVLLGRNVLNRFILSLDGKNLTFVLEDP